MVDLDTRLLRAFVDGCGGARTSPGRPSACTSPSRRCRRTSGSSRAGSARGCSSGRRERSSSQRRANSSSRTPSPRSKGSTPAWPTLAAPPRGRSAERCVSVSRARRCCRSSGDTMRLFAEQHPDVELEVSNSGLDRPAAGLLEGRRRRCVRPAAVPRRGSLDGHRPDRGAFRRGARGSSTGVPRVRATG